MTSGTTSAAATRRLDPDQQIALVEERTFLLSSLADLEAEYEAGDIDEGDYQTLRDDYTARAAEVIRAIDEHREARAAVVPVSWRRRIVGLVGVVLVAALAGWALAQASGSRRPGEVASGEIAQTIRQKLSDALDASSEGEFVEALTLYDEVLADNPSNAEALTYRGWLLVRTGETELVEDGLNNIEAAVISDPEYADARVFAASAQLALGNPEAAKAHLDAFDALPAKPAIMADLVEGRGLRQRIDAELGAS